MENCTKFQINLNVSRTALKLREEHMTHNKLQIGCGDKSLNGWINADIKKGDLLLDARKRFPFKNASIDLLFHEHFLEHLDYPDEASIFIAECYRVLTPEGVMRIAVPDAEYAIRAYINGDTTYFERCRRLWHPSYCTTEMESINFLFRQRNQHKFAYDYTTLRKLLEQQQFEVKKSEFMGSQHTDLRVDSWNDSSTLYVEAIKVKK